MGTSHLQHRIEDFSVAEQRAIEVHKYYLSEQAGYDVGYEYAIEHWLIHHASGWRQERLRRELQEQEREILKHKWIESEKAGCDLGQAAVFDWIVNHAAAWRKHWEQCFE